MRTVLFQSIAIIVMSLSIIGCGGGGGSSSTASSDRGTIVGDIKNFATGTPLAGVTVATDSQETITAADGTFTLHNVALSRVALTISKEGFAQTGKIVNLSRDVTQANVDVNLLPVAYTGTFDPSQGYTATAGIAQVRLDADVLVDANGNKPTTAVKYEITPIDPASMTINAMPGDMTVRSGDPLASYGALTVVFKDSANKPLNLVPGEEATIRIPLSSRGGTPPDTIPLYYYDEVAGVWVEEGSATLSQNGEYYEGIVGHFSTWNADYLYDSITISGCVQDANGNRVANAVVQMEGFSYNGMTSTHTDANGAFSILAMENATSLVVASTSNQVSNTAEVVAETSDVTLDECLIVADVPLTVRLTWGEKPYDLDTHVVGPNDYHIWFINLGSLVSDPFAQLDVDDVTSYGPEVFTALKFPQEGTYHYAVYNFSGTHLPNISNSPTRVEVTLNGRTQVFTPPAGEKETDVWWNVFDIIVNTQGAITIRPINSWSPENSGPLSNRGMRTFIMPKKG